MKIQITIAAGLLLALGGCATCSRYPVACGVAGAIVVGSVAATVAANQPDHRRGNGLEGNCAGLTCGSVVQK